MEKTHKLVIPMDLNYPDDSATLYTWLTDALIAYVDRLQSPGDYQEDVDYDFTAATAKELHEIKNPMFKYEQGHSPSSVMEAYFSLHQFIVSDDNKQFLELIELTPQRIDAAFEAFMENYPNISKYIKIMIYG
jgi:hypothetical protein